MVNEIIELLEYNLEYIDFIDSEVHLGFDCPLDVHCTYTRDHLLIVMDYMTPNNVREGVKWLPEKNLDVSNEFLKRRKLGYVSILKK